jgi:hypothetical protein
VDRLTVRLVRVTHYRCADYDCVTFALAPEEWDVERIETEVSAAQDAYLAEFDKARQAEGGPPDPGFRPAYEKFPDKLVSEVAAEHAAAKAAWKAWADEQAKTRRHFEGFLTDRGFVSLWSDNGEAVRVSCDWGHRHGHRLEYGDDKTDTMPTPAQLAGKQDYSDEDFA